MAAIMNAPQSDTAMKDMGAASSELGIFSLQGDRLAGVATETRMSPPGSHRGHNFSPKFASGQALGPAGQAVGQVPRRLVHRSEEHTSELQSLMRISYA